MIFLTVVYHRNSIKRRKKMNKDDSLNGNCIGRYYKLHGFLLYMFTKRSAQFTPSGDHIILFYVFTSRSSFLTPSGGSIFRCTTKDRGERRAKGVATPFNPPGLMRDSKQDVLCAYLLAMVQLTRLSRLRRSAYSLASACCGAVEDFRLQPQSCLSL